MEGSGTAGASARREYERRQEQRRGAVLASHPRIGKLLLAFQADPQHEKSWATGALGEERLGAALERRCPEALLLHDRRLPGTKANIDHIAVTASGIYVVDTKVYKGKIEVRKPLFAEDKLLIAGRDRTKLIDALSRQVAAVSTALATIEKEAPVRGCLCFLNPAGQAGGSGLPLLRTLVIREFALLYPKRLAKRLNQPGPLASNEQLVIAEALSERFPAA